jgi:hypothetical protein
MDANDESVEKAQEVIIIVICFKVLKLRLKLSHCTP